MSSACNIAEAFSFTNVFCPALGYSDIRETIFAERFSSSARRSSLKTQSGRINAKPQRFSDTP
jgi:hypothetical protein